MQTAIPSGIGNTEYDLPATELALSTFDKDLSLYIDSPTSKENPTKLR